MTRDVDKLDMGELTYRRNDLIPSNHPDLGRIIQVLLANSEFGLMHSWDRKNPDFKDLFQ